MSITGKPRDKSETTSTWYFVIFFTTIIIAYGIYRHDRLQVLPIFSYSIPYGESAGKFLLSKGLFLGEMKLSNVPPVFNVISIFIHSTQKSFLLAFSFGAFGMKYFCDHCIFQIWGPLEIFQVGSILLLSAEMRTNKSNVCGPTQREGKLFWLSVSIYM